MGAEGGGKTVLVIGSGGREHALGWKLSLSPRVSRVIAAPGNDGMPPGWERWPAPLGGRENFQALARRARERAVDLAVIGPDNPLAEGIVDVFEREGVLSFGPTARAARIESSKAFAKEVMSRAGVPTARYFLASSPEEALDFVKRSDWSGWVIKADGLAYGKGVRVCADREEALGAIQAVAELGSAASQILVEERLEGEELSWFAFCDGESCALLDPARDYKRVFDRDQGPNTGGMGAFSPVPGLAPSLAGRARDEVFLPVLRELKRQGAPFRGLLYAGLMLDPRRGKLWVLEFNCRFGDPEAQVVLARMEGDLFSWCEAAARGDLPMGAGGAPALVPSTPETAVFVVAASPGYPGKPETGLPIEGPLLERGAPDYFCASVARDGQGPLVTSGGRVFGALGKGATLAAAREQAYARIQAIRFPGMHYRRDIAGPEGR